MTQRLNLLNLHRSLALHRPGDWERLIHEPPVVPVVEPVEPRGPAFTAPIQQAPVEEAFIDDPDQKPTAPVQPDPTPEAVRERAQIPRITAEPHTGVLAVETLEVLCSTAARLRRQGSSLQAHIESAETAAGRAPGGYYDLVRSLFDDPDTVDDDQVASLIQDVDQVAATAEPQLVMINRANRAAMANPDPAGQPVAFDHAIAELATTYDLASAHVPATTCSASLIRVKALNRGRVFDPNGLELATCITTKVNFDRTDDNWSNLTIDDFYESLLNPNTWPQCHDFWCAMTDVSAELPPDAGSDLGGVDLDPARQRLGPDGSDSWLFWEQVGDSSSPEHRPNHLEPQPRDWFPLTFLFCRRQREPGAKRAYMTYELVTDIGSAGDYQALTVDNGAIAVAEVGDRIQVCTTKTIHFTSTARRGEGQSLAEFACISGWGNNARRMAESCRLQHNAHQPDQ